MAAQLITAVKELASCLMSLWRKLAHDLAKDRHISSEPNKRNMTAVKMAYQLNVRCDLYLWNAESKIVVENCLPVLRTDFSLKDSDVLKKWSRHRQTDRQTHTHSLTQTHNTLTHTLPKNTDHHTAEFLKTMSQLCDGVQCRLTARTAGSTEGEILAESWKRSKQTE